MEEMTTPKITIIVPVYNVEDYLQRCITSLTGQTLKEIEIILVDDGSTDKSGAICDLFAEKDDRIKVIHKQNEGQGIARNAGIDASTGEYICFLDSDDYLEKNGCEKLYAHIKLSESDICTYGYCIESPEGDIVRIPKITDRAYFEDDIKSKFILHFFGDDPKEDDLRGFSSCMSVFKTLVIRENNVRFPSEREVFSEDTVFCLEYCMHVKKAITTSQVFYHYCQKADSFSQGYKPEKVSMTMKMLETLKGYAESYGIRDEVKTRLSMYVWVNLMAAMKQESRRIAEDGKRAVKSRIQKLCLDKEICDLISPLKREPLPFRQKILLCSFLNKDVPMVVFLCSLRAKSGL